MLHVSHGGGGGDWNLVLQERPDRHAIGDQGAVKLRVLGFLVKVLDFTEHGGNTPSTPNPSTTLKVEYLER